MAIRGDGRNGGWLVDEAGTFWVANSLELRRKLFCVHYPGDLATDVIRNLGYIGVRTMPDGVHLRLHSSNLAEAALVEVIYWITDSSCERAVIEYLDDERPDELVRGHAACIRRLCNISTIASLKRRVSVKHSDITSIQRKSQLWALANYWKERSGHCDPDQLEELANRTTNGRFIRIGAVENSQFVVQNMGTGLQIPEPRWADNAIGKAVGGQGDLVYFNWVLSTYSIAWKSGRPDLSEVKATVLWPTSGWVQRHYERLLLPCVDTDGRRYLLSANGRPTGDSGLLTQVI